MINRCNEKGLASAVLAGAKIAQNSTVVVMDADLSHPPEIIPKLVEPVVADTSDMVIGSRYIDGGATKGWSFFRKLLSKTATLLAWPLTDVADPLSGFFSIKKEYLNSINKNDKGFKICLELLIQKNDSLRVTEVPIEFNDRKKNKSKFGTSAIWSYLLQLVSLAGGNISSTTGIRFAIVGLLGMSLDFSIFNLMIFNNFSIATTQLTSFFFSTILNFIFNIKFYPVE